MQIDCVVDDNCFFWDYEIFNDIQLAAAREKRLKEWKRQWKIDLIQKMNPNWQDLYHNIIQ